MLREEGIAKQILTEPIVLEWGIGNSKTILKEFVELSVQIAGWEDPSSYFKSKFYLSKNDGDALTLGYQILRRVGILRVLEPLIELQRQLGPLLVCPQKSIGPSRLGTALMYRWSNCCVLKNQIVYLISHK